MDRKLIILSMIQQYKKGRIFIRPFLYCKCNVRLKA